MSRIELIAIPAMLVLFLLIVVALFVARPFSVIQGYLDRLDFNDRSLPFTDQFVDDQGWVPIGGDVTLDQGMLVESSEGSPGGAAFLDNSFSWRDYLFQAQVRAQVGQNVGLIARLVDRSNFVTCNYSGDLVRIDQRLDDVTTTLARGTLWRSFAEAEGQLGIKVDGNDVSCLIGDTTIVETPDLSPDLRRGAIGIRSFDSALNHSQVTLGSVRVEPLQPSPLVSGACYDQLDPAHQGLAGNADRRVSSSSVWLEIYESYPCTADGKEIAYQSLEDWDIEVANGMIEDSYSLPRFDPVRISPITWNEDPYGEQYWRFVFYSLRPTGHLLRAWQETGDEVYRRKLLEILDSYTDHGLDGPYSWDNHGAAWRTMVLVNTWWKLRESHGLPPETGVKILNVLEAHGNFLADEAHYEGSYNHGVNQALALYILAVNFPDLPDAQNWALLASQRLDDGIARIVDQDGVLVENSPFYHLYTTRLYWGIRRYFEEHNLPVSGVLAEQLEKMVSYTTYIIQPDLRIPTIGASQTGDVKLTGIYQQMASSDPHFLYVLTAGAEGSAPPERNVHFPAAGQTIMRSGWDAGEGFDQQTQIIFDVGSYRTNHSDFDALSFHLFGKGVALLPDSGLYTYEDGPWRSYFHGTSSHNTVVVDGLDQDTTWRTAENGTIVLDVPQKVFPGTFYERDEVVYQSAQHNLYDGVIHRRAVALIGDNLVLIVDNLVSNLPHAYQQKFHLFPDARLDAYGLTAVATGDQPGQIITISQLLEEDISLDVARGETSPINGFCSDQYESAVPCYALSYAKDARTTSYVTLLKIGEPDPAVIANVDRADQSVTVKTAQEEYTFSYDLRPEFNLPHLKDVLEPPDCNIDPETVLNGYPRPIRTNEKMARSIPILTYHGIEESGSEISIPLCEFEEQMLVLKRAGYQTVTAHDFVEFMEGRKQLPDKSFLLTFDDGLKSSHRFADPILEELDYSAVMFIITGRSLGPGVTRFLSVDEVLEMSKSGRWDIQDHSRDGHDPIVIDQYGNKGHFLSHKLWLPEERRLETDEEYRRRLHIQFLMSKSEFERVLGEEPVLFAFPFGDYGQGGSSNMPEAEAYVVDELRSVYPRGKFMYQVNPNKGVFSHNYPDSAEFMIKRIRAAYHGGAHDLLAILEDGRGKSLPFFDDFSQLKGWKSMWSKLDVDDQLVITPDDGIDSGGVFLDGSFLWQDYRFTAEVRSIGSRSVRIYGRYVDGGNYSACVITDNSISIEERIDHQIRLIAQRNLTFQYDGQRQIGIGVIGSDVECFIGGEVVVRASGVNSHVPHGGVALAAHGFTGPDSRLEISRVVVEPIN